MSPRRFFALSVLLSCGLGGAATLRAVPPVPPAASTSALEARAGAAVSMDDAVRMAEQRFHAKVVKAETLHDNGRTVYVLRLLNEAGRVWTVRVDAANGAVL